MKPLIAIFACAVLAAVVVAVAVPTGGGEQDDSSSQAPKAATDSVQPSPATNLAATSAPSQLQKPPARMTDDAAVSPKQAARTAGSSLSVSNSPALPDSASAENRPLAPDFTLAMGNGTSVTLSELRGQVVVIDFWSTWCGPCKAAMPTYDQFARWADESGKPIKVYAVHTMEKKDDQATIDEVARMWGQAGYETLVLFDFDSVVARKFGVRSIPTTIVIDPEGRIAKRHVGFDRSGNMGNVLRMEALAALGE